ncbi:MAG: tRNA CCA-pyrophosphorylase [Deltaproteobacteria bacterium HGW-Deltaproteobacteria-14]|jgi:formylmethanofuran dehydrogenase subunit E|nr:MAG: tRNA CCA-pyrophosphorylase [Deltaproteobacteria bacterium HGW-Deltaproteobacteria-14]
MINPNDFLAAGQQLHGHKCPAMPLGLRAGAAAMNALGVDRAQDGQLVALVELGDGHCAHCFADGIQMITGCTFGKGNIQKLGYGKFGVTLIERATGRAVRVVPRAEAQLASKKSVFFTEYREKGIPASQVPPALVEPMIAQVMGAPQEQILKVGDIHQHVLPKPAEAFESFVCPRCGDMVITKYGRDLGGERICQPCFDAARPSA